MRKNVAQPATQMSKQKCGGAPACFIMKSSGSSSCSLRKSHVYSISSVFAEKEWPINLSRGHCIKKHSSLHHLMRIFSTPYMHIMSVHVPTEMKHSLNTNHNMIKKTFLRHYILHLNAKVSSVDVVCQFQKLQQVKTLELYLQFLSQHPPQSHTQHLQFTTHMAHRFLRTVGEKKNCLTRSVLSFDTRYRPALFPLQRHPFV
jgi:hypothetical protein